MLLSFLNTVFLYIFADPNQYGKHPQKHSAFVWQVLKLLASQQMEKICPIFSNEMLSDDISDHYLVLCKLHIVKAVNSTPSYKYGRTITSTTKDCFVSNLPDLSQFLSISNSSEQLDDVTETMNSLFSSTLDTVAPLRLRKIKEKSPTPWYNEHTRTLKRAARKMERSWRKTKLEVFRLAWRESTYPTEKL